MAITREKMVAALRAEVGTQGGASYWKELGYGSSWYNKSWCCCYVSVMLRRGGFALGNGYLNCGYESGGIQNGLKAIGAYQIDPKDALPGDVDIFDFVPRGNFDHIGFVTINHGTYHQTNEGNVSNTVGDRVRQFVDIRQCWHIPYATEVENGWAKKDGKYYYYVNGQLAKNRWAKGTGDWSGRWFYIGSKGYAVTNEWHQGKGGTWYWCGENGWVATNQWVKYNNQCYYVGKDGVPYIGAHEIDGAWYHFDEEGICEHDVILEKDEDYYYFGPDGKLVLEGIVQFKAVKGRLTVI